MLPMYLGGRSQEDLLLAVGETFLVATAGKGVAIGIYRAEASGAG